MAGKHRKRSRIRICCRAWRHGARDRRSRRHQRDDRGRHRTDPGRSRRGGSDGGDHARQLDGAVLRGHDVLRNRLLDPRETGHLGRRGGRTLPRGPSGHRGRHQRASATVPTPNRNIVLASGWGAGQTGSAFDSLTASTSQEPHLLHPGQQHQPRRRWVLDDLCPVRAAVGHLGEPTQTILGLAVIDTAYEYNINSNAVTYPLNVVSLGQQSGRLRLRLRRRADRDVAGHRRSARTVHYVVDENTGKIVTTYQIVPGAVNDAKYVYDQDYRSPGADR